MSDGLQIHHNPVPAAERVARWHGVVRSRMIMLAISVALSVAIYLWQRQNVNGLGLVLLVLWNLVPLVWLVVGIVYGQVAKRDLAAVGEGRALRISREGVTTERLDLPWSDVAGLTAKTRGPGRSPLLVVSATDGRTDAVALDYLDVLPSQIDDAVRAFTSGRLGLDLSATGV